MNKHIAAAVSLALAMVIGFPVISDSIQAQSWVGPPGTPAGTGGAGAMEVSWAPAPGSPTYYVLYWGTAPGTVQGSSGKLAATSFELDSLGDDGPIPPLTILYFQVGAFYANACSWCYSGWSCAVTTAGAPGAPTDLAAAYTSEGIALTWNAPASDGGAGITSYLINRSTASGEGTYYDTMAPGASYLDEDVELGHTYHYTVIASNGYVGSPSNEASASAGPFPPSAPTGVSAAGGLRNVTVTWGPPQLDNGSAILGYRVHLSHGTTFSLSADAGPAASFVFDGLDSGTEYTVTVQAYNAAGDGALSASATATTFTPPGAPSASVSLTGGTARVSWSTPSSEAPVLGYKLYRGTSSGSLELYRVLGDVQQYDDAVADRTTGLFYAVAAFSGAGDGALSNEVSVPLPAVHKEAAGGTDLWPLLVVILAAIVLVIMAVRKLRKK